LYPLRSNAIEFVPQLAVVVVRMVVPMADPTLLVRQSYCRPVRARAMVQQENFPSLVKVRYRNQNHHRHLNPSNWCESPHRTPKRYRALKPSARRTRRGSKNNGKEDSRRKAACPAKAHVWRGQACWDTVTHNMQCRNSVVTPTTN
jgi:hypothetical protein